MMRVATVGLNVAAILGWLIFIMTAVFPNQVITFVMLGVKPWN